MESRAKHSLHWLELFPQRQQFWEKNKRWARRISNFTCNAFMLADTFKTFTDSTGKSFLGRQGMLFSTQPKLHPLYLVGKPTWQTNRTSRASPRQCRSPQRLLGLGETPPGGSWSSWSWWVRVWSRRWKIEASCRSENRSQRPLLPSPAALTHLLSFPRSRSFLGCSIQRGALKNTNTQTPRFPSKNAKKTKQQKSLWQLKPVSVSLRREAEELTAAAFLVGMGGWERKCIGTSLVECI